MNNLQNPTRLARNNGTILIADDDTSIRTVLSQALARAGFQVRSTSNASTLWKWVKDQEGDLVLTDVMMPDGSVFEFLPRIRQERPKLPIIVMSAQNTLLTAISAAEQGAYEYLPKPFDLDALINLVRRALEPVGEHRAVVQKRKAQIDDNLPLIGRSQPMQEVYRVLSRVSTSNLSVILEGETGVGKKLIAKTIHDYSGKKNGDFNYVNLADIDNDTFNALFQLDNLEKYENSTILFDSIDDAPLSIQGRMFAFMNNLMNIDCRIIVTSTNSLIDLVGAGKFREDLFHLLNVICIKVPALRDRKTDIADLARLFLSRTTKTGSGEKILDKSALVELEEQNWPGNVRELENLMKRISILNSDNIINRNAVILALNESRVSSVAKFTNNSNDSDLGSVARNAIQNIFAKAKMEGKTIDDLYTQILKTIEKPLFELTLKETRGNQIRAAELLGLNRNTLRKRLTELNIT